MKSSKKTSVLISGASIAGLSTAFWMNQLGYKVTVVEMADKPRTAGAAVDIKGIAVDAVKRMGIFEQLISHRLNVELIEFKNADDVTDGSIILKKDAVEISDDEIEIERDKFIDVLYDKLKNQVEFIFSNRVIRLDETDNAVIAAFENGVQKPFDLVFGCDGAHSGVRKISFGEESEFANFLGAYSSITIVNKLLIKQKTVQMYNVPGKGIILNAYNNKTDIIFYFLSEKEIAYDYRNTAQQKKIISEQFEGQSWRIAELLEEINNSNNFYFDKFCQIKMPSWTKGRVALIGDAAYCASPAAGMGASLSVNGAVALADALEKHNGNFEAAFQDYNRKLRPYIEEVQAAARLNITKSFIPRTEEEIRRRNTQQEF